MVHVRYFAAAEEFAGRAEEVRFDADLAALRVALVGEYPLLGVILPTCALLVDGVRRSDSAPLSSDTVVDVLPPFAGG